jgi:hypothetical protein
MQAAPGTDRSYLVNAGARLDRLPIYGFHRCILPTHKTRVVGAEQTKGETR